MRKLIFVLTASLCLLPAGAFAQTDTAATKAGTLRTFENDLVTPPPDTVKPQPREREREEHHRWHHDDDDDAGCDTGGFWSGVFSGLFRAIGEGYASLPNPNYGPYPYSSVSGFDAYGAGNATYLTVGLGYQHTYHAIPTACTNIKFMTAALVVDAFYQQYRESSDRLHLSALKIGARKAVGGSVLWQNHLGLRNLKGYNDLTGGLLGTELQIYPGSQLCVTMGYDLDFFPRYGTVFHDLSGSLSCFFGRVEIVAGYNDLITYKGASLQGPFIGATLHF